MTPVASYIKRKFGSCKVRIIDARIVDCVMYIYIDIPDYVVRNFNGSFFQTLGSIFGLSSTKSKKKALAKKIEKELQEFAKQKHIIKEVKVYIIEESPGYAFINNYAVSYAATVC